MKPPTSSRRQRADKFIKVNLVRGRMALSKGRESWLITLAEVKNKEEADALSQYDLFVKNDDRPPLEDGEFYAKDLMGIRVILQGSGEAIGRVADVYGGTGTYDTVRVALVETGEGGAERETGSFLIPFQPEMVPRVDAEAGTMTINPPEGLLDATTTLLEKAEGKNRRSRKRRRPKGRGSPAKEPQGDLS